MNVTDLRKRLAVEVLPVYILKGQDAFLKDAAIKILSGIVDADYADFNLQVFEDASDIKEIVAALNTVPVFADRRFVIVKSADGLDEGGKSMLEAYLKNPAEFSVLVFADDSEGGKAVDVKNLNNFCDLVVCDAVSDSQFAEWVVADARRHNESIEASAVRLLLQYTGGNMTRAMTELQKLYALADGGAITAAMVEEAVSADNEYKTFALTNALTKGNNTEALKILQSLLDKGESPSGLLSLMTNQYRRMLEAKISTLDSNALAKAMGVKPGSISIAKELASGYTPVELKKIVDTLHGFEFAFKSGANDESAVLHEAFAMLLRKK